MRHVTLHKFLVGLSVLMLLVLVSEEIRWGLYVYERWGRLPWLDEIKLAGYFIALLPVVVAFRLRQRTSEMLTTVQRLSSVVIQLYLIVGVIGGLYTLFLFSVLAFFEYQEQNGMLVAASCLVGSVISGLISYLLWRVSRPASVKGFV